jgi:hypothetical protein
MEMQGLLGIGTGSSTEIVRLSESCPKLGSREATKVCGLVCAYRLVDVVAMLEGGIPNVLQVQRRPDGVVKMLHVRIHS